MIASPSMLSFRAGAFPLPLLVTLKALLVGGECEILVDAEAWELLGVGEGLNAIVPLPCWIGSHD
jgi:hypothetical protein